MNDAWFNLWDDEDDEVDESRLLAEFEKLLNGEDNDYEALAKDAEHKPDKCWHTWEKSGQSMLMKDGEYWYNCKKCGIAKEKYEKSKNSFLTVSKGNPKYLIRGSQSFKHPVNTTVEQTAITFFMRHCPYLGLSTTINYLLANIRIHHQKLEYRQSAKITGVVTHMTTVAMVENIIF